MKTTQTLLKKSIMNILPANFIFFFNFMFFSAFNLNLTWLNVRDYKTFGCTNSVYFYNTKKIKKIIKGKLEVFKAICKTEINKFYI